MVNYRVTVSTGNMALATTMNNVFIKLVGEEGESKRKWLASLKGAATFYKGSVSNFDVSCPKSLGKLVLIELDKQPLPLFAEDDWFCSKVEIKAPEGQSYLFPVYRWISDKEVQLVREATALRPFEDTHPLGQYSRVKELKKRKEMYSWDTYAEGIPHNLKVDNPLNLPAEVRFSFTKATQFLFTSSSALTELSLKGLTLNKGKWDNLDDLKRIFWCNRTPISEYVEEHWKEDEFFGYQFLNGVNPILIRRCSKLPDNFPVTEDMVRPSFFNGSTDLKDEMQKGNIFLCDYKRLDGVPTNVINGKKQYLMSPLVLLLKTPNGKLKPIAIQLKQQPGDDNPIFLPTDSEYDWLLAKVFVRSADFSEHQLNAHLLRTHLLCEVFAVALLRNVASAHPLYKLLIPHTRYTLQINYLARLLLISKSGVFTQFAASGGEGMFQIMKRAMSSFTYTSMCLPEDISERGMESVPNFYYRDDGLKLWEIIHRFVQGLLGSYYKTNAEVEQDTELQSWMKDIFERGFLSQAHTGIPQRLSTVSELVKFVTMVIFTGSAQHSAVNSGQYDYGGWMPNTPITMQLPPPTTKGRSSERTLLETLPDVNTTAQGLSTVWLLSKQSTDFVALGQYPDNHFSEEVPINMIKAFQTELEVFSAVVKARNKSLDVAYTYLDPTLVENSVAI